MLKVELIIQLLKSQLGPIQKWLDDEGVNEVMANPGGDVFVEANGVISHVGRLLSEQQIAMAIKAVAKKMGRDADEGRLNSLVNASVDDLRISGALKPVSPLGSFLTIRRHRTSRDTLEDLVDKRRMLTQRQAGILYERIIVQRQNCLVIGGTGSGKTTFVNALLGKLPAHERIVSVEDALELKIGVPNCVPLLTNPDGGISARELVKQALRLRPDRIILGETRGDETYDLIRGLNSGHPGSLSTIHGDSAEDGLSALEMMFQMSLPPGAAIPAPVARQYIAKAIKLVVFVNRSIDMRDGVAYITRNIQQIRLIKGEHDGKYDFEDLG